MAVFVSMVTWHHSMAHEASIRAHIDREEVRLYGLGMHSIVFVSDAPGESAAVLIVTCADHAAAATVAEAVLGDAVIRVDSLRFDEPTGRPAWLVAPSVVQPRPPRPPRRSRERSQALAA